MIYRSSINVPLDEPVILNLPEVYRTIVARDILRLLEDRLVHYEPIPTVIKHLSYFCHNFCYRIRTRFFWPRLRSDISNWI